MLFFMRSSCSFFSVLPQESGLQVLVLLEHDSQAELFEELLITSRL